MSTNKEIARNASIISAWTLLSRVLGFARDILIAAFFGTLGSAQAFVVAFRIPNLLRDIVAEGAANSGVVPVLAEYEARKNREEFWYLVNCLLNLLIIILAGVTILGIVLAPVIVRIIAPGFSADAYKLQEAIKLTRIIYPFIFLISLAAYSMAVLNTLKHFSVPAFAPCLLNISVIVFAVLFKESTLGLALGVLAGGLAQFLVQVPILRQKGFSYIWVLKPKHPGVKQAGRLILPRIFSSSIYQLNVFVDTVLSSLSNIVGQGAVAALYYANRIFQFPLGIFAVAIAQAALPVMSVQALDPDKSAFKKTLKFSLVAVFLIMLPITAVIAALSGPIVQLLFQRGRFDAYSSQITSGALLFYSLGLLGYSANKVLVCGFFSLKDTITPLKITGFCLLMNILLNLALMSGLKLNGLALASAITGTFNFLILLYYLRKKIGPLEGKYLFAVFLKIFFCSGLMSLVIFLAYKYSGGFLWQKFIFAVFCGGSFFALLTKILKLKEIPEVMKWIFKRK